MENQTFNYKDDKFSIRPQAPPGGESHFNISDSGYGDKEINRKHKRNNHPSNDINPPPNFVKKEDVIESTPNGAAPVTGNRPSIKLSAPPGGFSSFDNYDESKPDETENQNEPITDKPVQDEPQPTQNQSRKNSNVKPSSFFEADNTSTYKPYYAPQAPPGGKSSISFGYDEPVSKPKPKPRPKQDQQDSTLGSKRTFRPVYTPQAPPGGKSSISFGDEEPVARPKPRPNPEFKESYFNNDDKQKTIVKQNISTKQNNQNNFNSSFFGSNENDEPYKPYYAPQAPPGGKDSISFGNNEANDNTPTTTSYAGRRRNYENDHFKGSYNETNKNDEPYKPYYAPQAPPGGKDSISFNNNEAKDTTPTTTSFAGRRRNYNSDHFKSSISFNY